MTAARVAFPSHCTLEDTLRALDASGALAPDVTEIELALGDRWFFDAGALAVLGAWGEHRAAQGVRFTVSGAPDARDYLARMNLFHRIGVPYEERFQRRVEAGRFVPLTPVEGSSGHATNLLCDLVMQHFDNARDFLPAFEWAMCEVVDNQLIHAESATPGLVCAQFYPKRQRLEVAVVDMGRGLRASLSESRDVPSDADAVNLALQRGVTRNLAIGQGNGLAGTRDILRLNGGYLSVWSGDARYRMSHGAEQPMSTVPRLPGTGLLLALDPRNPVDLRQTFIRSPDFTYVDAEATRIGEGGLRIVDASSFFGARPPATRIRRKVLALLPEIEGPLVLDFTGVRAASSSFLDELLGRLADELGPSVFAERIAVVGLSDALRDMANVVIHQRLSARAPRPAL